MPPAGPRPWPTNSNSTCPPPGEGPTARFADHSVTADEVDTLASAMPFDVIIGSCNPLALPLVIEFEPPKAIGRAAFTAPYEGAPGCVHGAALAGAFDIMLTAANVIADGAGPTVKLSHPLSEAHADRPSPPCSRPGSPRSTVAGPTAGAASSRTGVVTVEAVGEFVNMERSRISAMHRRPGARTTTDQEPEVKFTRSCPAPGIRDRIL